jgi:hypothetical protein
MSISTKSIVLACLVLLLTVPVVADVTTRGQIEGRVVGSDASPLPGVTVTLRGTTLQQGALVTTTDADGRYRFPNLLPGTYQETIEMSGMNGQSYTADVRVGKTVTLDGTLKVAAVSETVTVAAAAPLFDQNSAAHGTNFTDRELQKLPTTRQFIDIVDAAAGFDNQAAYGAGGNVAGYDKFGFGAATNSYQLNGVNVSNLEFGNSWVNPNYDTIQEIQIVGPGGSAEYSNYSGAVVNVVTKAGTNELKGTASLFYTNHSLTGDNSGGILDLEPGTIKNKYETALSAGGPIVPEKLLFFGSFGYNASRTAPPASTFYDNLDRKQYQLRMDYYASTKQNFTGMINHEPILDEDLGLLTGAGPEIGYKRKQHTTTDFLSWIGQWSQSTLSELRYAGEQGYHGRIPNAPLDVPGVNDLRTGLQYNSVGFQREQSNRRHELHGVATHYVDQFMGTQHELKGGIEYEKAQTHTDFISSGNVIYTLIPIGALTYVSALVGYNVHAASELTRPAAFVQDRATIGRSTVSVGLRYDQPKTKDLNTGKTLLDFNQFAPRLGFTYDFAGNGRSVARVGAGRYFDKVPTYGPGQYAGTGLETVYSYGVVTDQPVDPTDTDALYQMAVDPANLTSTFDSTQLPVESNIKGPHADVLNLGFDQELGKNWALSLNYINRKTTDFIVLTQFANQVTYEPFDYTSDFSGRTFPIYKIVAGGPREYALGNRSFFYQKTQMAIAEVRGRATKNVYLDASMTFEQSRGTRQNNECAVLSLCTNGVDTDPNFEQNPFYTQGSLSQERPWNFKVRGDWSAPFGFEVGWDARYFAGRRYGAVQYCFEIEGCNDPNTFEVQLEPRDARKEKNNHLLNLRVAKNFNVSRSVVTLSLDALNVTNQAVDFNTNIQNNIDANYAKESGEQGKVVSAFGKPYSVTTPRQYLFGLRVAF